MVAPRVSVIVPYREGGPERERNWQYIRALYERRFPSWQIITAPGPDGEFCRAGAICDAITQATGDVFVVADADVWCEGIESAVARVAAGAAWADPAESTVVRMTQEATEAVLGGAAFSSAGAPTLGQRRVPCGGLFAISRACLLRCQPDRRFVGWGAEDHAWAAELARMYGPASTRDRAPLWHLWHPPGERKVSTENRRLLEEHLRGPGPARPRILILADVPTWAWARKARALKACLASRFDIRIVFSSEHTAGPAVEARSYELLHAFEVFQSAGLPPGVPFVTGITAHVYATWEARHGTGTVRKWAERARGFHANSILLQREMEQHLERPVWYVPNGVDERFFRRTRPHPHGRLVVGFVGKDNPRKGYAIVQEACERAGVELREVRRRSQNALSAEDMRAFYQGIHVLAVASDMDGTPNPALEAAACECAVVSNPIGNMPEFIEHGKNGLLVERNANSLAAALSALARRPIGEVEEMGRAARHTIEAGWTWRQMAENYAAMWQGCLAGQAAP